VNLADQLNQLANDVDPQLLCGAEEIRRTGDRLRRRHRTRLTAGAVALAVVAAAIVIAFLGRPGTHIQPAPQPPTGPVVVEDAAGSLWLPAADGSSRGAPMADARISHFALSPDGTKVVFDGYGPGGKRGVWIVNAAGTHPERVKLGCGCLSGWGVDWSHDGTRLAYVTSAPDEPWTIRVRTLATGAERSFTMPGVVTDIAFSPDDTHLAFTVGSRNLHVATIDIDQGLASLRAASPVHRNLQAPAWSADGTTIYYTASDTKPNQPDGPCCLDYNELDRLRVNDVYAVDAQTGNERQITHAATGELYYTVHPHGHWFLTSHTVNAGGSREHTVIGWLSRNGKKFEPILDRYGRPVPGLTADLQP
jgi:WD40 repeat protein